MGEKSLEEKFVKGEAKPELDDDEFDEEDEDEEEDEEEEEEEEVEEKTNETPTVVLMKLDLHCEGCARKVRRAVSNFQGVESAKADANKNELIVIGSFDPELLREKIEFRTRKNVVLISPPHPKKSIPLEKKVEVKPNELVVTTVDYMMRIHCEGCARKIKRTILKNFDDVETVTIDMEENLVTVTGTMDVEEVASFLGDKFKRDVEILLPPENNDGGDGEVKVEGKKKDDSGEDSEDGDESEDEDEDEEEDEEEEDEKAKVQNSKMKQTSYNPSAYLAVPVYNRSYPIGVQAMHFAPPPPPTTYVQHNRSYFIDDQYPVNGYPSHGYSNHGYGNPGYYNHGYVNHGYAVRGPPMSGVTYMNNLNEGLLSDENPYGCSIM